MSQPKFIFATGDLEALSLNNGDRRYRVVEKLKEQWMDIPGYVGLYQISNFARIRSRTRVVVNGSFTRQMQAKIISQHRRREDTPLVVNLCKNANKRLVPVHDLFAATWGKANGSP